MPIPHEPLYMDARANYKYLNYNTYEKDYIEITGSKVIVENALAKFWCQVRSFSQLEE